MNISVITYGRMIDGKAITHKITLLHQQNEAECNQKDLPVSSKLYQFGEWKQICWKKHSSSKSACRDQNNYFCYCILLELN